MKKSLIHLFAAITVAAFQLSCTSNGETKYTGNPSDIPGSMDNPGSAAGQDSRGTHSAAEMDSMRMTSDTSSK